jgi:hypothetical protein
LASGEAGPASADHGLRRATHTGFKWYKVKGKIKEIAGTLTVIQAWKQKAKNSKTGGFKKNSARSRRPSENGKDGAMASNFGISVDKISNGFGLKLAGDFDATLAYELIYAIGRPQRASRR